MRAFIAIAFIIGYSIIGNSQKLTFDFEGFPLFTQEYGRALIVPYSAIGLSYFYQKYETGMSFRSVPWGSEISINQGLNIDLWKSTNVAFSSHTQVLVGIPLYYNKFSTSYGIASRINIKFNKFRRVYASGGLGYRINPSYQNISIKYQYFEGILGLHIALFK